MFCGRGGIVFWADLVGPKHIYDSLKKWSGVYGNFYKPSRFLEERAMKGVPLVRTTILIFVVEFFPLLDLDILEAFLILLQKTTSEVTLRFEVNS